jgi:hypothetical protein
VAAQPWAPSLHCSKLNACLLICETLLLLLLLLLLRLAAQQHTACLGQHRWRCACLAFTCRAPG